MEMQFFPSNTLIRIAANNILAEFPTAAFARIKEDKRAPYLATAVYVKEAGQQRGKHIVSIPFWLL